MTQFKKMLFLSVLVALASQLFVNFFIEGFIVTFAIILLPLILYLHPYINPLKQCLLIAIVSPLFRGIIEFSANRNLEYTFTIVSPDAGFYIFYGLVFYFLYWNREKKDLMSFVLTIFIADFSSNIFELLLRTNIFGMDLEIIRGLALIALVRFSVVSLIILFINNYQSMILRVEHENRYRKLVLLTSSFKSEIYFMQKNMKTIEDVMNKSYRAHKLAEESSDNSELKKMTLDVSKDIHEIKKDYIRVIKGLEDISNEKLDLSEMTIKDLFDILITNTKEVLHHDNLNIKINSQVHSNVIIMNHYYFMSILRNIVNNSIEALDGVSNPKINLSVYEYNKVISIVCSDNGNGIHPTDLDYIFNPGFSTKFDVTSGNISRGLGLTLVHELVVDFFKGSVNVKSSKSGTTMTIVINRNNL